MPDRVWSIFATDHWFDHFRAGIRDLQVFPVPGRDPQQFLPVNGMEPFAGEHEELWDLGVDQRDAHGDGNRDDPSSAVGFDHRSLPERVRPTACT